MREFVLVLDEHEEHDDKLELLCCILRRGVRTSRTSPLLFCIELVVLPL